MDNIFKTTIQLFFGEKFSLSNKRSAAVYSRNLFPVRSSKTIKANTLNISQ